MRVCVHISSCQLHYTNAPAHVGTVFSVADATFTIELVYVRVNMHARVCANIPVTLHRCTQSLHEEWISQRRLYECVNIHARACVHIP